MADEQFDLVKIRTVVLGISTVWMTVDDIQKEITAMRERAGEKPAHVPIQLIQQVINHLVEQGSVAERREQSKPLAYRVNRDALIARRAKLLRDLMAEPDYTELEAKVLDRTGASAADVEMLLDQKVLDRRTTEAGPALLVLRSQACVEIVDRGAAAYVGSLIPADADDRAVGEDALRRAIKEAADAKERAVRSEARFMRLKEWLAEKGIVDVQGILEPPPPPARQQVFEHTERRHIDDAEKGRILVEVLALEHQKSVVQLQFDSAKSKAKAELEKLDAEIESLKSDAQSNERVVVTQAYKEVDWKGNAVVIRAAEDGREIERQPIPRGSQKPLPGTEESAAPASPAAPAIAPAQPADARPAFHTNLRAIVLDILRGTESQFTAEQIAERIRETYSEVPDGLEPLLKVQIHQLIRAKEIARDKKSQLISLADGARPLPASESPEEAAPQGEPGPLADPERRRRGNKKSQSGEASP